MLSAVPRRAAAWAAWKTVTSERNNSELQDSMMNQGLTTEQIEAMKDANVGGAAIVNALLANSETFEAKTEFSQVNTRPRSMCTTSDQPARLQYA